jgi:hypothetical protein
MRCNILLFQSAMRNELDDLISSIKKMAKKIQEKLNGIRNHFMLSIF